MNAKHTFARRLFAGLAAAATLLAGGVFASSASAAPTYKSADDFIPGNFNSSEPVKLTVTKYTSFNPGNPNETGSAQDANKVDKADKPESGVVFSLTHIVATAGHTESDFRNDNSNQAWTTTSDTETIGTGNNAKTYSNVFYGITGTDGVINQWYKASDWDTANNRPKTETPPAAPVSSLPNVHQYYLLHQENKRDDPDYKYSEDSVFDLPYRATNDLGTKTDNKEDTQDGFVYNLHVFPKNVSTTHVHKTVKSINGKDDNKQVAQIGDKITYELSYKFDGVTRPKKADGSWNYDGDERTKVYVSDIMNPQPDNTNPTLRLVDRYSDHLLTNPTMDGDYSFTVYRNGAEHRIPFSSHTWTFVDYNQHTNTASTGASPNELNANGTNSSVNMFTGAQSSTQGINYLIWDFSKNTFPNVPMNDPVNGFADGDTDPTFHVDVTFTLASDDQESNLPGSLVNDLNSSSRLTPKNNPTTTYTPSAGFQFGKTDTEGNGLDGAVFRLVKGNTSGDVTDLDGVKFLASNGNYYYEDKDHQDQPSGAPAGVTFVEATSNNHGIVTFQNLPIFNQTSTSGHTSFINPDDAVYDVVEYKAPDGYKRATVVFGTVSFAGKIKSLGVAHTNTNGSTTYEIPADLPEHTYITPDDSPKLDFGKEWTPSAINIPSFENRNGETVTITTALEDFNHNQNPPIHLPLTGGMGIVLLLVIGAVIMAIVIIERKRREANARR